MPASTLSHEIASVLRSEILRQQFRSGERLPSERDLATRFTASRGAVREALSQLEQLGLIRIHPGGARVQAIDAASISILGPLLALNPLPDPVLVDQFLLTFGALAALTTRTAIATATRAELNRANEMIVSLSQFEGDFDAMQKRWRELLEYFSMLADNLVVKLISNDLKAQFVEQMGKLGIRAEPPRESTRAMLADLRKGIANRDGELAGLAMQNYFDELRRVLCKAIANISPEQPAVAQLRAAL